LGKPRDYRSSI